MTITPERIAEIEADGMCTMEDETAELCRLARLGLRVEGAPTFTPLFVPGYKDTEPSAGTMMFLNPEAAGKEIALVALDGSPIVVLRSTTDSQPPE